MTLALTTYEICSLANVTNCQTSKMKGLGDPLLAAAVWLQKV